MNLNNQISQIKMKYSNLEKKYRVEKNSLDNIKIEYCIFYYYIAKLQKHIKSLEKESGELKSKYLNQSIINNF